MWKACSHLTTLPGLAVLQTTLTTSRRLLPMLTVILTNPTTSNCLLPMLAVLHHDEPLVLHGAHRPLGSVDGVEKCASGHSLK